MAVRLNRLGNLGFLLSVASPWVHSCMLGDERICLVLKVCRQLRLKLPDLVTQVCNDVLVGGDMLADHLFVRLHTHLDIFRSVSILQGVDRLFVLLGCR